MVRLLKSTRESIVEAAISLKFDKPSEDLADKYAAFAADVYDAAFSRSDRQRMADLPKGWLPESDSIRASIAGTYLHLHFSGAQARGACRMFDRPMAPRRVPYDLGAHIIDAGTPLADRWQKLQEEEADLNFAIQTARTATEQLLSQISSTEKLAEIWPEGVQFLPEKLAPVQLPALPVADVNKMLGL